MDQTLTISSVHQMHKSYQTVGSDATSLTGPERCRKLNRKVACFIQLSFLALVVTEGVIFPREAWARVRGWSQGF